MNEQPKTDPWAYWRAACEGKFLDHDGPQWGYYRDRTRRRAFALSEQNGQIAVYHCGADAFIPRDRDELLDLWRNISRHAVRYEVFEDFRLTGKWPETVEPIVVDHTPKASPAERFAADVAAVAAAARAWFESIGKEITNDEQDGRLKSYCDKIASLERLAETTRDGLVRPHLEAQRAINAEWKPVVDTAKTTRTSIAAVSEKYRIARLAKIEAERQAAAEAARAEQVRVAEENADRIARAREHGEEIRPEDLAPIPTAQAPIAPPTGLRTVDVFTWTDQRAFFEHVAKMNAIPEQLLREGEKIARKWLKDGVQFPGAKIEKAKRAS